MKIIEISYVILGAGLLFAGCNNESPQGADKDSIQAPSEKRFLDFNVSVQEIYGLKGDIKVDSITNDQSLYTKFEYNFELTQGGSNYFVVNSLTQFHNEEDLMKGWEIGEESFYGGIFSEGADTSEFSVFRSTELYKLGDYSEYSELRKPSGEIAVIYHLRVFNTILNYGYVIDPKDKERLMKLLVKKVDKLKPFLRLKTTGKNIPKVYHFKLKETFN